MIASGHRQRLLATLVRQARAAAMDGTRLLIGAKTAWRLGPRNVYNVLLYRLRCRLGMVAIPAVAVAPGDLFVPTPPVNTPVPAPLGALRYFGWKLLDEPATQPPDWFLNPFTQRRFPDAGQPWYRLPDFDAEFGDIKCVWAPSRWDWMLPFAQHYRRVGDALYLANLNTWLRDWLAKNPAYRGPNWKCGQEASIRVMHLAMTALILDQVRAPSPALIDLIRLHLRRIAPTLGYAMAQNNNHGTSEAAALFIGGSWLEALGYTEGNRWARQGRYWLENRVLRLIEADGSFSQYSVNYHRLMLDTLSMAEVWRRRIGASVFSPGWRGRAEAAAPWLYAMTDPLTGDAPNLGANDGAQILPLAAVDFRDFRPSVQLAMVLFAGQSAYPGRGDWNDPLHWLGIDQPEALSPRPESQQFDDGGYALLRRGPAMALMRYPRFRFRPGHADALHVDLWKDGVNLLRDSGTFSYNTDPKWMSYFSGTASHNTVQFDDRDQMPRLGRFLFGGWLKTEFVEELRQDREATIFTAAYRDSWGAHHERRLALSDTRMTVQDRIEGFAGKAILRWRLLPATWRIEGATVTNGEHVLSIEASMPIRRLELVIGWESRYYMQKTELPVLEVEVGEPCVLVSEYRWSQ